MLMTFYNLNKSFDIADCHRVSAGVLKNFLLNSVNLVSSLLKNYLLSADNTLKYFKNKFFD